MKKQVPEEVELESQYVRLRERLLGNPAFGRRRGRLSFAVGRIRRLAESAETPTAFQKELDLLLGDVRSLGTIYAQMMRDNCPTAAEELLLALRDKTHVLPGESVPVEKTTPYVLLVPDPQRTFQMLRFMLLGDRQEYWRYVGAHTEQWRLETAGRWNPQVYVPQISGRPEVSSELANLLAAFPSLLEIGMRSETMIGLGDGDYFYAAWVKDVLSAFPDFVDHPGEKLQKLFPRPNRRVLFPAANQFSKYFGGQGAYKLISEDAPRVYAGFGGYAVGGWGFLVQGKYEHVLSRLSRKDQDRFAYWALDIPSALMEERSDYWPTLGFHHESEHADWRKRRPALVSHGVSHGWGAIILDNMSEYQSVWYEFDRRGEKQVRSGPLRLTMSATQ